MTVNVCFDSSIHAQQEHTQDLDTKILKSIQDNDKVQFKRLIQNAAFVKISPTTLCDLLKYCLNTYIDQWRERLNWHMMPLLPVPDYLSALVTHPSVKKLPHDQDLSALLGKFLLFFIEQLDPYSSKEVKELIKLGLHENLTSYLEEEGEFGLNKIREQSKNNPFVSQLI